MDTFLDTQQSGTGVSPQVYNESKLLALFDSLGIVYTYEAHEAVMTVEESRAVRKTLTGSLCKCLFLQNKNKLWLVAVLADARVDLKSLGQRLESGRLSFASAERMRECLGVSPGSVTVLAAVNDTNNLVTVVLDEKLLAAERLLFHPLVNTASVGLTPEDLLSFLRHTRHCPEIFKTIAS